MNTVTDKIGEEYENWDEFLINFYVNDRGELCYDNSIHYKDYKEYKDGNCIFISAPTGSGKTYFILNIWLKYLVGQRWKMLYLVNRSILKRDIEKKIYDMHSTDSRFIDVKLYQEIEAELKAEEYIQRKNDNEDSEEEQKKIGDKAYLYKDMRMKYVDYDCVVCDECHYFLTDSNFNTDTSLSFRMIQDCFAHKVRIFMSATINDVKAYIKEYDSTRLNSNKNNKNNKYYFVDIKAMEMKIQIPLMRDNEGHYPCRYFDDYVIDKDYDYLDAHVIYNVHGKNKKAESIIGAMDITESTDETQTAISKFINEEGGKEKWLIFFDNKKLGEKLEKELGDERAVFISATNRRDGEKLGTVEEIIDNERIEKQILIATSVLDNGINLKDYQLRNVVLMADTETEFIQMLGRKRADGGKVRLYIYHYDKKHFENRLRSVNKRYNIAIDYENNLKVFKEKYVYNYDEDMAVKHLHIKLMREIADNKIAFEDVKSLFNVYGGVLYLNLLAYQNLKNLKEFYEMVLHKFDENGEDAFVKIQLGWLGIDEAEADKVIEESKLSREDKCLKEINDWMGERCNNPMSKKDYIESRKEIHEQIKFLAESTKDKGDFEDKVLTDIKKTDRPLTDSHLKYLKKFYEIPYSVIEEDGEYTIVEEKCQSETPEKS